MLDDEIYIRIPENGIGFIFSIVRAGETIRTGAVTPPVEDEDELVLPGQYYGGSQAMD